MDLTWLAKNWWAVALRGVAALVFGIVTMITPGMTLAFLVALFGVYAIVEGVLSVIAAVRARGDEQPWWLLLLEGLVSIAAGVVTFIWPGLTALVLVYVIAAWAVITGAIAIAAAVALRKQILGEGWLILSGILSVVFGAVLMVAPGAGALALVLWIGAYAIVFGALLIALAFRLRGRQDVPRRAVRHAV